jgi:hypothetical protein
MRRGVSRQHNGRKVGKAGQPPFVPSKGGKRKLTEAIRFLVEEVEATAQPQTTERGTNMFRNTILALAATAGLIGGTEFGGSQAKADGIHVGGYGRNGAISIDIGGYRPGYYRPIYQAPVVYYPPIPPAPVYVTPAPVYVTPPAPVCHDFAVYFRPCASEPWQWYGTYGNVYRADVMAGRLRVQGFQAYVGQR